MFAAFLVVGGCGSDSADSTGAAAGSTDGPSLYTAKCALCHGTDLRGTQTGPSLLSAVYAPSHHSDQSFTAAVRKGVIPHHWRFAPMPPITGLSDDQISAIVAYVRALQLSQFAMLDQVPPDVRRKLEEEGR